MANTQQDTSRQKFRRYTIPDLLQLAQRGQRTFDLSRFTYDAARAGVVPPLGDCAVTLRRTSGNRSRGWSTETVSTNDEIVVLPGNTVQLPQPERQPRGPPGGNTNQKESGFARFLKKHSSPTHNRVTAGGRIVPMEQRGTPPRFDLPQPGQPNMWNVEPIKQALAMQPNQNAAGSCDQSHQSNVPVPEVVRSPISYLFRNDLHSPPGGISAEPGQAVNHETAASPLNEAVTGTIPSYAPQPGQLSPVSGLYYPQMAIPVYPGSPGFMAFPQLNWPYSQMNSATAGSLPSPAAFDREAQSLTSSRQALHQARNDYDSLSEQLQTMDRHRAMSRHDPNLSHHRLAVVEQREQKRRLVQILEKKVAIEQSLASLQGAVVYTPQLNVQAPAYVPKPTDPNPERTGVPFATKSTDPTPERTGVLPATNDVPVPAQTSDKPRSATKRKPIPIVPPPEPLQQQATSCKPTKAPALAEKDVKEPSADAETAGTIKQERPQPSTQEPMQPAVQQAADRSQIGTRPLSQLETDSGAEIVASCDQKGAPEMSRSEESSNGVASASMHELWDIELDALRLPEGMLTRLEVSNGQWLDIAGVNLQCSPESKMTDFETKYWASKPVFTKDMLHRLRRVATIENIEQLDVNRLLGGREASDSLSNKENVFDGSSVLRYRVEKHNHGQHDYTRNALQELSLQLQNTSSKRGENGDSIAHSHPTTSSQEPSGSVNASLAENISLDPMGNKGYSSVSVQNVHATIHLPPTLDGAGDGRRRNAKSMLTSASKIGSPGVVHRSDGGKWLGPHFRGVRAQGQSEGNPLSERV